MNIGWIDFSKEQRNKVLSVINLLSEPGAVDELGIGIIRDAFADIFFPGTSTIQTRAKYFLITAYLLSELEREKGLTPDKMISRLNDQELDLIDVLKQSGEKGIIGETAGRKLKRKPSDVYWNGIRTFGIFKGNKISLYEYARVICLLQQNKHGTKSQGSRRVKNDDVDGDDVDAVTSELYGGLWKLPDIPENWRDNISIKLTVDEALFLKRQITATVPNSMLAFVLSAGYTDFLQFESFADIAGIIKLLPDNIKADYIMSKDFADFIFGMQIRYNVILSKGQDNDITVEWESWYEAIEQHSAVDLHRIFYERLNIKNGALIRFLLACQEAMRIKDIHRLDELIIMRERKLKGDKRAKLYNAAEFDYKGWVGIGKLQYRLGNAQRILTDIFAGRGDVNV